MRLARVAVVRLRLRGLVAGREQVGCQLGRELPANVPKWAAPAGMLLVLGLVLVSAAAAEVEPSKELARESRSAGVL